MRSRGSPESRGIGDFLSDLIGRKKGLLIEQEAPWLIPELPERGKILDAGAGEGDWSRAFAERGFEVDALEIDENSIGGGRKNWKNVNLIKEDVITFVRPQEYDVIWANFLLNNLMPEEILITLDNFYQSLRNDGLLSGHLRFKNNEEEEAFCSQLEKAGFSVKLFDKLEFDDDLIAPDPSDRYESVFKIVARKA